MRTVLIAIGALAATAALFLLGIVVGGLLGAALGLVSIAAAAVVVGWVISEMLRPHPDRPPRHFVRAQRRMRRASSPSSDALEVCGECGDRKELRSQTWVCVRCDLGIPAP